jgi:hypothetical protein
MVGANFDREEIRDAIYSAMGDLVDAGVELERVALIAGGLDFLITGEDGIRLRDDELLIMASNEGALASMLYEDLQASWPGPQEETWKIADTIAAACGEAVR